MSNHSDGWGLKNVFWGIYRLRASGWAVAEFGARRQLTRLQLCGFAQSAAKVDVYLDGGAGWNQVSASNFKPTEDSTSCIESVFEHSWCERVGISVGQDVQLELRAWGLVERSQLFLRSLTQSCRLDGLFMDFFEWCAAELWVQRCLSGSLWDWVHKQFWPHMASIGQEPTADLMHEQLTKYVGDMDQETFDEVCAAPGTKRSENICHTASLYLKWMPGLVGWKPDLGWTVKMGSMVLLMSAASLEPSPPCQKLGIAVSNLQAFHLEFKTATHVLSRMGRATQEQYDLDQPDIEWMRGALMPLQASLESTSAGIVAFRRGYVAYHQHYLKQGCKAEDLPDNRNALSVESCWRVGPDSHDCCRNSLKQLTLPCWGAPAWSASETTLLSEVARVFEHCSGSSTCDDEARLRCRWNGIDAQNSQFAFAFAAAWLQRAVQMQPDVAPQYHDITLDASDKTVELQSITHLLDAAEACLRFVLDGPTSAAVNLAFTAVHPLWMFLDRLSLPPVIGLHHEGLQGHAFAKGGFLMAVLPDREEVSMNVIHKATAHCPVSLKSLLEQALTRYPDRIIFFAEVGGFLGDCVLWAAAHPRMFLLEVEPHKGAAQRFAKSVSLLPTETQRRIRLQVTALGDQTGWFQLGDGTGTETGKTESTWLRADNATHRSVACQEGESLESCVHFKVLGELLNGWLEDTQLDILRIKANGFEPAILRGLGNRHRRVRWIHADCWKPQLPACLQELSALGFVVEDSWCSFGRDCIALGRHPSESPLSSTLH